MATFTSVGDSITIEVLVKSELAISISGTYNMKIAFQQEVGSPGSGTWSTIETFETPNATVSVAYSHANDVREFYRLIVTQDTSGSATATLTSTPSSGAVLDVNWGDIGGTLADQTDLQAVLDNKLEAVPDTAVTPGSYTNADITVDSTGRITAADNGDPSSVITSGTVTPMTGDVDFSGGSDGQVLTVQADGSASWETFPGGGDMTAATYDPQAIVGDAFDLTVHTGEIVNAQIAVGAIENDNIRDAAALSVIGRSANSSGDVADISTTAGSLHVLREASNVIGFGALSTSYITSGTFADARIAESNVTQHVAAIDHDATLNFVADEHIAHSGVTLTAGTGLTGGGTIAASRTFDLEDTAVTPDTYTLATITVDQQGRITAASSGLSTDAAGSVVTTSTGALTLTTADHALHNNVLLSTDQASAVFTISDDIAAGIWFAFAPAHDGATVEVEGGAGSINGTAGGTARLINGGHAFARVVSNAGTAIVILSPTLVNVAI